MLFAGPRFCRIDWDQISRTGTATSSHEYRKGASPQVPRELHVQGRLRVSPQLRFTPLSCLGELFC
jgi:hypothetical protein